MAVTRVELELGDPGERDVLSDCKVLTSSLKRGVMSMEPESIIDETATIIL